MELVNKSTSILIPKGSHNAVCTGIVDLGSQETKWGPKGYFLMLFEITDEIDPEDLGLEDEAAEEFEGPVLTNRKYSKSVGKTSNFGKDLKTWMDIEVAKGEVFNPETLVGEACLLNIVHTKNDSGTFANIDSIMPPMKNARNRKPTVDLLVFSMKKGEPLDVDAYDELPNWMQEKIAESPEFEEASQVMHEAKQSKKANRAAKPTKAAAKSKPAKSTAKKAGRKR